MMSANYFLLYLLNSFFLLREARSVAFIIREGVDEMVYALANNTLNLCHAILQEVGGG